MACEEEAQPVLTVTVTVTMTGTVQAFELSSLAVEGCSVRLRALSGTLTVMYTVLALGFELCNCLVLPSPSVIGTGQ